MESNKARSSFFFLETKGSVIGGEKLFINWSQKHSFTYKIKKLFIQGDIYFAQIIAARSKLQKIFFMTNPMP